MTSDEFIAQLRDFSTRYKIWWCEPFEKFLDQYKKEHQSIFHEQNGLEKYQKALEQFEENLRKNYDLLEEIYNFLDINYEIYLQVTSEQRGEIRSIFSIDHFEKLLLSYTNDRALKRLNKTGNKSWLLRGLVAVSMENCEIDDRDTLTQLVYLYIAAQEMGIDPEIDFQAIAKISSQEKPRGGLESMGQMMAGTRNSARYRERTKSFSKR